MRILAYISLLLCAVLQLQAVGAAAGAAKLDHERLAALSQAERAYDRYQSLRARYDQHIAKEQGLLAQKDKLTEQDQKEAAAQTQLQDELSELIAEKQRALEELRLGYYCSRCGRPKSQVERETQKSFGEHLVDVNGQAKPASPERLQAKSDEYDRKIKQLRKKIEEKSESARAASEKRWLHYNEGLRRYYDERKKIIAELNQSSREYFTARQQYTSLTPQADQAFDAVLQLNLRQRVSDYCTNYASSTLDAFRARMQSLQDQIKAGQTSGLDGKIAALKAQIGQWQSQYSLQLDLPQQLSVAQEAQNTRAADRVNESQRAQRIQISAADYHPMSIPSPALRPIAWNQFYAAIQVLEDNSTKLKAVAQAQQFLNWTDAAATGFSNSLAGIGNRIGGFFGRSQAAVEENYQAASDYLESNRIKWFLKSLARNYPGVQNILTDLVGEKIDELGQEVEEIDP